MSVEKTVTKIQPSEEPQKLCSNCNEPVEKVSSNFHGTKFLCSRCLQAKLEAKKAAKDSSDVPSPAHKAPKRGPQQHRSNGAHQDRRQAGGSQNRHAPCGLTLETIELCAFHAGLTSPQVNALMAEISAAIAGSSTSK